MLSTYHDGMYVSSTPAIEDLTVEGGVSQFDEKPSHREIGVSRDFLHRHRCSANVAQRFDSVSDLTLSVGRQDLGSASS